MVFLLNLGELARIKKNLTNCEYLKIGTRTYSRPKNPPNPYPFYKVELTKDDMGHNLLVTITMETLPEHRILKDNKMVVYHRGTFVEEELARIVKNIQ